MSAFGKRVQRADKNTDITWQIVRTVAILLLGAILGTFSKFLDDTPVNYLPVLFAYLDIGNFLGRFAFWILLAVCIAVYSASPRRAAINVFVFFAGMVTSYYLYSALIAGFFPRRYAMIWAGLTLLSPVLAAVCWYAKGDGTIPLILSAGITAVLFNVTFAYGLFYISALSPLELAVFLCGCAVMRRKTARETVFMLLFSAILACVLKVIVPFSY